MSTSLQPFRYLQIGEEAAKGTLVAATDQIPGEGSFAEEQDFYRSSYPAGVRSNVGGAGVVLRNGVEVDWNSELTAEDMLWPLHSGILGNVTPVPAGADNTWTFTPELTTGIPTLDSVTLEFVQGDGVTNHYYGEAGYGLCRSFKMDWSFNQLARANMKWFARARQTGTPTAALTPTADRTPLTANLLFVYLDTTWAGLGTTQLTGLVRSASIEVMTGLAPDYTLDGRTDKDLTIHKVGNVTARLSIVFEFDAGGASRFANYRANDLVYIRLKNEGPIVPATAVNSYVQVDGAYRFVSTPSFAVDGEQVLMTAELESVYDATGTKTLEFELINGATAL